MDRKQKSVVRRGVQWSRTMDKKVHACFATAEAPGATKVPDSPPTTSLAQPHNPSLHPQMTTSFKREMNRMWTQ